MSDKNSMPVVILAGGLGFRTKDDVEFHPKPLVEVGERPLIWHLINSLAIQGVSEFIVCVGAKGNEIRDYFSNFHNRDVSLKFEIGQDEILTKRVSPSSENLSITLLETGKNASTGERLRKVKDHVGDRTFACVYGDVLANVSLKNLIAFHRSHAGDATLTAVHPKSRFNVLQLEANGEISSMSSTPILDNWINGGYYVFEPSIFTYLDGDSPLEDFPLQTLVAEENIFAFQHTEYWQPIDTQRDVDSLSQLYESGVTPWILK